MSQIAQGSLDPPITPGTILFRHPHDQCCDLLSCWTSAGCTKRTPIIFPGDQPPMPREQCFRRDDCRDLRQQLSTNLLRLCGQPAALIVTEPKAPVANLFSQNSVFL